MRSAGSEKSNTSVVRHIGRRTGRSYETPVVAVEHEDSFLIAIPHGDRTDWIKNVLASGTATVVTQGHAHAVDNPQVIPMTEATRYFRPREQKLHQRFAVNICFGSIASRPRAGVLLRVPTSVGRYRSWS
jgi:deazaflavin-dependent oxidoreductase (nitroreductase family)